MQQQQQPLSTTVAAAAAENVNPQPASAAAGKMSLADAAGANAAPPAKKQATEALPPQQQQLRVRRLTDAATLPVRGSALAAGYDVSSSEDSEVPARGKALVSTGLVVAVPEGTYGRVAPRSGLAWKHFIDVGAGVIDADYRGELKVLLFNHSDVAFKGELELRREGGSRGGPALRSRLPPLACCCCCCYCCCSLTHPDPLSLNNNHNKSTTVNKGDRVAQLVLERIVTPEVVEDADLGDTARGAGGFGSTGVAGAPPAAP
jgi:dUTP pyrophosphatase